MVVGWGGNQSMLSMIYGRGNVSRDCGGGDTREEGIEGGGGVRVRESQHTTA